MPLTIIGSPPWTEEDVKSKLDVFAELYKSRPIEDNTGGMRAPHLFAAWFIVQYMKFENIIESGVWKGQGTWAFEQADSNAKIFSIDIKLPRIVYTSDKVTYYNKDFYTQNWDALNKKNTLCFFDDHINALERSRYLVKKGFKYAIFEDNYATGEGGAVSLKQKFDLDDEESAFLRSVIKTYYEFPPVVKLKKNRWGKDWNGYPTKPPILFSVRKKLHQVYKDEAGDYTWLCYVEYK